MNKVKIKKILNIALNALVYFFLALCIVAVIVTAFFPRTSDGATVVFDRQFRVVTTGSMAKSQDTDVSDYRIKSIPQGSLVFIKNVPDNAAEAADWYENEVQIGDVLTFKYLYERQLVITHRVVDKYPNPDGEGYVIVLEGDNKSEGVNLAQQIIYTADEDSMNYIIGKVQGKSYVLGLFIGAMKNPISLLLFIILPCLVIIVLEIIKIARVMTSEKKEIAKAENEKKDAEIENLRRQLEMLQHTSGVPPNGEENKPLPATDGESSKPVASDDVKTDGEKEDPDVT